MALVWSWLFSFIYFIFTLIRRYRWLGFVYFYVRDLLFNFLYLIGALTNDFLLKWFPQIFIIFSFFIKLLNHHAIFSSVLFFPDLPNFLNTLASLFSLCWLRINNKTLQCTSVRLYKNLSLNPCSTFLEEILLEIILLLNFGCLDVFVDKQFKRCKFLLLMLINNKDFEEIHKIFTDVRKLNAELETMLTEWNFTLVNKRFNQLINFGDSLWCKDEHISRGFASDLNVQ